MTRKHTHNKDSTQTCVHTHTHGTDRKGDSTHTCVHIHKQDQCENKQYYLKHTLN